MVGQRLGQVYPLAGAGPNEFSWWCSSYQVTGANEYASEARQKISVVLRDSTDAFEEAFEEARLGGGATRLYEDDGWAARAGGPGRAGSGVP